MRQAGRFAARTMRASAILLRDERVPRTLRWAGGIALLPIPGPLDEAVLLLLAPIFLAFFRPHMREAWQAADGSRSRN